MKRITSKLAYDSITDLGSRQYQVLAVINNKSAISNLDIASILHLPINQVTPRTNELVQMGFVQEKFTDKHPTTGRKAIYWTVTAQGQRLFKKSPVPWGQLVML